MVAPSDVMEKRGVTKALVIVAALSVFAGETQALAFNAPQPIKYADLLKLNQQVTTTSPGTIAPAQVNKGDHVVLQGTVTVSQALDQGLLYGPRVAAARALLSISKALYATATQMPNPQLNIENAPIAEQTFRVGSTQIIEPPWKIAFRLLAAKQQVREAKLQILSSLWLLRNDIRRAYTELVVAQESYQMLTELTHLANRLLEVSEARFQSGDVPELDVLKARLASSQTKLDMQQGARRIIRAQQMLNVIIGNKVEEQIQAPKLPTFKLRAQKTDLLPDFDRPVPPLREFAELGLANRLELKLVKQQIKRSEAQLAGAYGNIAPDVIVGTGKSVTGNPPNGPKLNGYYTMMSLEMPVFTYQQGEIARLKASIKQLKQQYHSQESIVVSEVSSAYNNLLAARERIKEYQEHVLADSEEVARLAQISYEAGQSDITSTLAAQQQNVLTQRSYLDAVTLYQQAFTDLEQAVGEPLQ